MPRQRSHPTEQQVQLDKPDEFMAGVQLIGIRLIEESILALVASPEPAENTVNFSFKNRWAPSEMGFQAQQSMETVFTHGEEKIGHIICVLALDYTTSSDRSAPDYAKQVHDFVANSVQFHAWPYLREYLQNCLSRMGWPSLCLPLLKQRIVAPVVFEQREDEAATVLGKAATAQANGRLSPCEKKSRE